MAHLPGENESGDVGGCGCWMGGLSVEMKLCEVEK